MGFGHGSSYHLAYPHIQLFIKEEEKEQLVIFQLLKSLKNATKSKTQQPSSSD
jgi:hypothetical protein